MRFLDRIFYIYYVMANKYTAIQYIVYLLSRRDYSELELRQKLHQKSYAEEDIEQAMEKAQSYNWQNDQRFCTQFIRSRANQGYGPNRLKQELRLKGISSSLIAEGLENAEIDWFELAEKVFKKKCPTTLDIKAKQKLWQYMLSHGFTPEHFGHLMELSIYDE
ncbi:regulatory protein [Otariodibacter oris]|uniref:Regulatory protein RecX n=2 Tax=Otariodibacter oris TaxID=1032623 RepID=A0A420XEF7_9PAST|nr:regulatory protein [Otariodibacter oris]